MLNNFPGYHTSDPEVNRRVALSEYGARHFEGRYDEQPLSVKVNWADTKFVRVTKVSCSAETTVVYDPAPSVRLYFRHGKSTRLSFRRGGETDELSATSNGCVIVPAGTPFEIRAAADHELVALRLSVDNLIGLLSALLGENVSGDLHLKSRIESTDKRFNAMRNAVLQFIADLDDAPPTMLYLTDTFGQAILVRFLMSGTHS